SDGGGDAPRYRYRYRYRNRYYPPTPLAGGCRCRDGKAEIETRNSVSRRLGTSRRLAAVGAGQLPGFVARSGRTRSDDLRELLAIPAGAESLQARLVEDLEKLVPESLRLRSSALRAVGAGNELVRGRSPKAERILRTR